MAGQPAVHELDYDTLDAIGRRNPVECARLITALSRERGTLPSDLADLRKTCLHRARTDEGRRVAWIAMKVGIAPAGISRLTAAFRRPASEVAS